MAASSEAQHKQIKHHCQGPPGTKPYCIREGSVLHVTASYPYMKLEKTRFRLLKLFPKSYKHPTSEVLGIPKSRYLHATISEHDIDEDVSYDCLSYVWEKIHTRKLLWLDTFYLITISENLDMALRCLQLKDKDRLIWVDFLCINQDDFEERRQQVGLMYQIFSNATTVVAYLGHEADGSEDIPQALQVIQDVHFEQKSKLPVDENRDIMPWTEDEYTSLGLPPSNDAFWSKLEKFLSRSWFGRAWIMQEALAAKQLDVICGLWQINGTALFSTLGIGFARRLPFHSRWRANCDPNIDPATCNFRLVFLMLELGLCGLADENEKLKKGRWPLIDILERSKKAKSTNPQDKVFALLNLCADQEALSIQPDYSETCTMTYKRVAQALIMAGHGPKVICNASATEYERLELPSWVPDWSVEDGPHDQIASEASTIDFGEHFDASGTDVCISLADNSEALFVEACVVDTIGVLGDVRRYNEPPPMLHGRTENGHERSESQLPLLRNHESSPDQKPRSVPSEKIDTTQSDSGESDLSPLQTGKDAEAEWAQYPILFRYVTDVSTWIEQSPRYSPDEHLEVLWRTMVCDRELGTQRKAPDEYYENFHCWWENLKFCYVSTMDERENRIGKVQQGIIATRAEANLTTTRDQLFVLTRMCMEAEAEKAALFDRAARRFCFQLRASVTRTGFVGLVPQPTEPEDVLALIKGVKVPIILRPRKAAATGELPTEGEGAAAQKLPQYTVVGQAYFYGMMNGEIPKTKGYHWDKILLY
ncbi:uncharacterized protein KY384_002783 [Bacidia gigantensis]|uniref:uncharacterized protein n=1 Tax=Bacidia gigantensis TaxID=2732470 RepID=UPI001D04EE06|nr:uncharacterized protein KY384_002783 [Bacidia gigantensis]KAG8532905.1 hypothetical protein KY384_002783 [Bacidia gigantensis]